MRAILLTLLAGCLLLIGGCAPAPATPLPSPTPPPLQTLLPPEAIRALDHPYTVAAGEADGMIAGLDMVIGIELNGEARAYPLGLMSRHEIANDTLGGEPIALTFCPLCNSGVAVSRRVVGPGGAPLDLTFGVSGKILDNALVMVDRQSGSFWPQSRLRAVEGTLAGTPLTLLASSQMPWSEWVALHPTTTLARDDLRLQAGGRPTLPLLRVPGSAAAVAEQGAPSYVLGVASATTARAFPLAQVERAGVVNEELAGSPPFLLVALGEPGAVAAWQRNVGGRTLTFFQVGSQLQDRETGSRWDPRSGVAQSGPLAGEQLESFPVLLVHWLGWKALYPDSAIWQGEPS